MGVSVVPRCVETAAPVMRTRVPYGQDVDPAIDARPHVRIFGESLGGE